MAGLAGGAEVTSTEPLSFGLRGRSQVECLRANFPVTCVPGVSPNRVALPRNRSVRAIIRASPAEDAQDHVVADHLYPVKLGELRLIDFERFCPDSLDFRATNLGPVWSDANRIICVEGGYTGCVFRVKCLVK